MTNKGKHSKRYENGKKFNLGKIKLQFEEKNNRFHRVHNGSPSKPRPRFTLTQDRPSKNACRCSKLSSPSETSASQDPKWRLPSKYTPEDDKRSSLTPVAAILRRLWEAEYNVAVEVRGSDYVRGDGRHCHAGIPPRGSYQFLCKVAIHI